MEEKNKPIFTKQEKHILIDFIVLVVLFVLTLIANSKLNQIESTKLFIEQYAEKCNCVVTVTIDDNDYTGYFNYFDFGDKHKVTTKKASDGSLTIYYGNKEKVFNNYIFCEKKTIKKYKEDSGFSDYIVGAMVKNYYNENVLNKGE